MSSLSIAFEMIPLCRFVNIQGVGDITRSRQQKNSLECLYKNRNVSYVNREETKIILEKNETDHPDNSIIVNACCGLLGHTDYSLHWLKYAITYALTTNEHYKHKFTISAVSTAITETYILFLLQSYNILLIERNDYMNELAIN